MSENEKEKRIREAWFFDGILAAAYENMQSAERLIEKHWKGVDITDLKEAMVFLDLFQARVRGEASKWDSYHCCTHCGPNDWVEFEKPHGAPYYRCRHCGAEFMATEVER